MELRLTLDELARVQANPLPWWSAEPRLTFGRITAGAPVVEMEPVGNDDTVLQPTGWATYGHRDINDRDVFLLEVLRAGWAYVDSLEEGGEGLEAMQAEMDWAAWEHLKQEMRQGLSAEEAEERAWQYILVLASSLGLEYTPPVVEGEEAEEGETP